MEYKHFQVAKMLIDAGADVNVRGQRGTPLNVVHLAMDHAEGSIAPFQEVIELLKAHGAR